MSDTTHVIGSTGIAKKLVDLGDDTYADAVVDFNSGSIAETAVVLAAPTGSTGGLGKLPATIDNTEFFFVRCDTSARPYTYVDWVVSHAQQADMVFYKSQTIQDEVTLTLASFTDTNTVIINGLTYTGESTANTANWAGWKFSTAGADDTADALALANLINTDYVIATDGSVTAGHTITVVTDEDTYVYTAAAVPDLAAGIFDNAGTCATSIAAALNHKGTVTCVANPVVGDTVTAGGQTYTFATVEDTVTHAPTRVGTADAIGTSLAACVNADTTAQTAHGVSASNNAGVVTFTRTTPTALGLTSSNATKLAVVQPAGVPGITAVESALTAGEVGVTPVWVTTLTITEDSDDITVTDIDCPGVFASPAAAVVTLTPGTPAGVDDELATVIYASSAANCTVSEAATLAGLYIDTAAAAANTGATNHAATTGTAGSIFTQAVGGANYCYLGFTADNATTQAVSVSAIKRL